MKKSIRSVNSEKFTLDTKVTEVMNDPVFGDYGRLIFPVDVTIGRRADFL